MEQIALVKDVFPDGTAEVLRIVEATCPGNCAMCGGCPEQKPMRVHNDLGAKPGEKVVLQPDRKVAGKIATLLYTVPVALILTGYLLGEHFLQKGGFLGLLGGALGLAIVLWLDKKMSAKNPVTFHITDYAQEEAS